MENRSIPVTGELYRHFKNKLYQIVTTATHSETGERMVVYQALYGDYSVYVRPLALFMSEVDHEKYPDVAQKYRFERVAKPASAAEPQLAVQASGVMQGAAAELAVQNVIQMKTSAEAENIEMQPGSAEDMLMNFLDAGTYAEKLNILRGMKKHITDKTAYDMAVSLDIVLNEGSLEDKIGDLENCLKTHARFECSRLR